VCLRESKACFLRKNDEVLEVIARRSGSDRRRKALQLSAQRPR